MAKAKITLAALYELLRSQVVHLETHTEQFIGFKRILKAHDAKFSRIEELQSTMALRLINMEAKIDQHSVVLNSLRERTEALYGAVDHMRGGFDRLEQEYAMILAALRRLEQRFDRLEAERISERLAALEARLSAVESTRSS
jgi:chromosome segregation ATPase